MLLSLRTPRVSVRLAAGLLLSALTAAALRPAAAADGYTPSHDPSSPITDHFYLRVSYFHPALNTTIRADPAGKPYGGTQLSGEDDLGLPSKDNQARMELMFRLRERNRIRVDYFQENRSGSTVLTRPIVFGDETFAAGSQTETTLNWKMMGFTYTRAFLQTPRFELGAGIGLHLIQADGIGSVPATFQRHETSVAGAWPTIATDGIWRISRRFAFTARAQYLGVSVNGLAGSLGDYHGDVQYRWRSNFAIGLGYEYIRGSFQSNSFGTPGLFMLSAGGPEAFLRVSF
jgi:hypothetical protein